MRAQLQVAIDDLLLINAIEFDVLRRSIADPALTVKKDPRTPTTPEDFQKQLALGLQIRDKLSQANEGVIKIREAKRQLEKYAGSDNKVVAEAAKGLSKQLTAIEQD